MQMNKLSSIKISEFALLFVFIFVVLIKIYIFDFWKKKNKRMNERVNAMYVEAHTIPFEN